MSKPEDNPELDEAIHFHRDFDDVYLAISADVPAFMSGPAGSGKTSIAKRIAERLGLDFYYTGAIESAFQVKGFIDAHGKTVRTQFREAYEKGGLFLFDELDASESHAIVALHAALDNGILDAPDGIDRKSVV